MGGAQDSKPSASSSSAPKPADVLRDEEYTLHVGVVHRYAFLSYL